MNAADLAAQYPARTGDDLHLDVCHVQPSSSWPHLQTLQVSVPRWRLAKQLVSVCLLPVPGNVGPHGRLHSLACSKHGLQQNRFLNRVEGTAWYATGIEALPETLHHDGSIGTRAASSSSHCPVLNLAGGSCGVLGRVGDAHLLVLRVHHLPHLICELDACCEFLLSCSII